MTACLFVDFECTSLDSYATYLEVAWAMCDINGTQRTPLRSRYCAFAAPGVTLMLPQARSATTAPVWTASAVNDTDQVALDMAVESGLFDDWLACPRELVLTDGTELQRLLLDDVISHSLPDEYVHIAGAGAARFDYRVLEVHCPGVLPVKGARQPTHYRPVDTSIAQTALLGNNSEDKMIKWAIATYADGIDTIETGRPPACMYLGDVTDWSVFRHRAAPDVARSIVIQRALWRYAEPLRLELGLGVS
jgi:hypothetical protein